MATYCRMLLEPGDVSRLYEIATGLLNNVSRHQELVPAGLDPLPQDANTGTSVGSREQAVGIEKDTPHVPR